MSCLTWWKQGQDNWVNVRCHTALSRVRPGIFIFLQSLFNVFLLPTVPWSAAGPIQRKLPDNYAAVETWTERRVTWYVSRWENWIWKGSHFFPLKIMYRFNVTLTKIPIGLSFRGKRIFCGNVTPKSVDMHKQGINACASLCSLLPSWWDSGRL